MTRDLIQGSGGGGCFIGDTHVSVPKGYKKIKDIRKGDIVLSFDDKGVIHESKVIEVFIHENEEVWEYNFWGGFSFLATPNHWILNQFNAFVGVGTLEKDDCAVNQNNHLVPFNSKKKIGLKTVYNLNVENKHTFIANNIRVHNAGLGSGIRGAGGGGGSKGGGGRTPTTAKDSLNSRSFARILDLVSEGEIEGLHDPGGFTNSWLQSVFVNNTPLKNSDGTNNFLDVEVQRANGTAIQPVLNGFNTTSTAKGVGITCFKAAPVSFTITDPTVTSVIIDIRFAALQKVNKDGDTLGSQVDIKFSKQVSGSSMQDLSINGSTTQTVKGRTGDAYTKQYSFDISGNSFPVTFQVSRLTDDDSTINANSSDELINHTSGFVVASYQMIKNFDNPISGTYTQSGNTITVNTAEDHTKIVGDSLGFDFLNDGSNNQFGFSGNNQTKNNSYTGPSNGNFTVATVINSNAFTVQHTESKNVVNGSCTFSRVLNYPNSALVGLKIDAEQFNSIPKRAYLINGIKVRIPAANSTGTPVVVRNASQAASLGIANASQIKSFGFIHYPNGYIFNGQLTAAQYTNDPAFCLLDLLTSERYGTGQFIKLSNLDIYSFYAISKYSSELVSFKDRRNTGQVETIKEPRFSLNCVLRKRQDAFKVINSLCSVFRGMPLYTAGSITLIQDKNGLDPSFLFNKTNVTKEGFNYSGVSRKTRANVVVVKYFDNELRDSAYEEVLDQNEIDKYGAISKNIDSFGVTSRTQARRLGKWFLTTLATETETVSFTTTLEAGALCRPGMLIEIQDEVKSGVRRAGKIFNLQTVGGNHVITTDQSNLPNLNGNLSVIMPNGQVSKKTVQSIDVVNKKITINGKFQIKINDSNGNSPFLESLQENPDYIPTFQDTNPNLGSTWVLETTGTSSQTILSQQYKVVSVEEGDDYTFSISAVSHNESKYAAVEQLETLVHRDLTNLDETPSAPERFAVASLSDGTTVNYPIESLYKYRDQIKVRVIVQWKPVEGISKYELIYNQDNKSEIVVTTQSPSFDIDDVNVNTATSSIFNFQVRSVSASGKKSADTLSTSLIVQGKNTLPSQVSPDFSGEIDSNLGIRLSWTPLEAVPPSFSDLDIRGYIVKEGSNYDTGTLIGEFDTTNVLVPTLPSKNDNAKVYSIKAVDSDGNVSADARTTSISINNPSSVDINTISQEYKDDNLILNWTEPTIGTNQFAIKEYEIFDDATSLGRVSSTTFTLPVNFNSDRNIKIKAFDILGKEGSFTEKTISFTKTEAPNINFSFEGTKLRLFWTEPTQGNTKIKEYEIRRSNNSITNINQATLVDKINSDSYLLDIDSTFVVGTAVRFFVVALDANGFRGDVGRTGISNYPDPVLAAPPAPQNLTAIIKSDSAFVSWDAVSPLNNGLPINDYKIYRESGTATTAGIADFQQNGTQITERVLWTDLQQKYFVRAVDTNGNLGALTEVLFTVASPSAVTNLRNEVIDNNVLLRWTESSVASNQLPIIHYNIYRNTTASENLVGQKQGTFTTVFEQVGGDFTYILLPVNSAGLEGSQASTLARVNQPPDFVLTDEVDSTFSGTIVNGFLSDGGLFFNVNTTRTWKEHFDPNNNDTSRTFGVYGATTVYALPTENSGSYEEVIDTGADIASTRIEATLGLDSNETIGSTTVTPEIFTAPALKDGNGNNILDGNGNAQPDTFTGKGQGNTNVLGTNFRYIKVKFDFIGVDNNDLVKVQSLKIKTFLKRKTDQGSTTVSASDSQGTGKQVNFTETFVDVDAISLTIRGSSSSAKYAIYDFVDTANPQNGFKVFLFDNNGVGVAGTVDFTVRGV